MYVFQMSPGKGSIIKVKSASDCSTTGSRREMSSLIPNSTSSSQKSERRNIKVVEFSFSSIKFEEELGEGAFGNVCYLYNFRSSTIKSKFEGEMYSKISRKIMHIQQEGKELGT